MFYGDHDLKEILQSGDLKIDPIVDGAIRPASVILHLSSDFIRLQETSSIVDPTNEATYPPPIIETSDSAGIVLGAGQFILGATVERIGLANNIVGHLSNISGLARLGLSVAASTHVAPGFGYQECRSLTLEIFNASNSSVLLRPNMRICHLMICNLRRASSRGYEGRFPFKYVSPGPGTSEYFKAI